MSVKRYAFALALLTLAASLWAAAPIAGTWAVSTVDPDGNPIQATLIMKDEGGKLAGRVEVENTTLAMSDASMSGDLFTCKVTHEGRVFDVKIKVASDSLEGAWMTSGGGKGDIKGKRAKS